MSQPIVSGTSPMPGAAVSPVPVPPVVQPRVRPPLVRPDHGRVVAGVAAGLADHLGVPRRAIRVMLVLTTFTGGFGLVLYIWLWALVPSASRAADSAPSPPRDPHGLSTACPRPTPTGGRARARVPSTRLGDVVAGALLLTVGLLALGSQIGWQVPLGAVLPLIVVLGGAALVYTQLDEVQESRWSTSRRGRGRTLLRVVAGVVLVLGGVMLAVVKSTDVAYAGRVLAAVAAMLGGALVVLAPWGIRFWRDLDAERAARVRESERADIAAHLHDSVLQTLALIQRNHDDPTQVVRLARAQERDLRSWLYGGGRPGAGPQGPLRWEAAVKQLAAEVEDLHGVAVDVVVVGDREVDGGGQVLLAALREATVNAVRHAGGPVTVYAESGPDGVEASVRDRGPGFDPDDVPDDRHGVRESIIGRMRRHAGSAEVRSVPGEGTEVRLAMPDGGGGAEDDAGPQPRTTTDDDVVPGDQTLEETT